LLLNNRRTLQEKRVGIDNEIRGTLKAFGVKIRTVTIAGFRAKVIELLGDRPRLLAMVEPMLDARDAIIAGDAARFLRAMQRERVHSPQGHRCR
jgi:transposase